MADEARLSPVEVAAKRERRLGAMRLQEIEGNPLTPGEVRMFEMFERAGWSDERCRPYILTNFQTMADTI